MDNNILWDLMNSFIDTPLTEEVVVSKYEKQYVGMFSHSVPREMLPPSVTEEQLDVALKKCVEMKEDALFRLLGIAVSPDFLY